MRTRYSPDITTPYGCVEYDGSFLPINLDCCLEPLRGLLFWRIPMKMPPLYLAFDLIGKILILGSIGVQLLIMTPTADEVSENRINTLVEMALLNQRVVMLNMGVPPDNSPSRKGIAGMFKDGWEELDRKVDIELAVSPILRKTRNIFIVIFTLGTILTVVGTTSKSAAGLRPRPSLTP